MADSGALRDVFHLDKPNLDIEISFPKFEHMEKCFPK